MKRFLLFPLLFTIYHPSVSAMTDHSMHHMDMHHPMALEIPASTTAYQEANHAMHMGMMIRFTGDADIDFLRGMIPHHQGAVDMAKIQLEHGQDGALKHLTRRIIRDQNWEIRFMKRRLEALESEWNGNHRYSPSTLAFRQTNKAMHEGMNIEYTGNADLDFTNGMIPHHQGAIDMAKIVLQYGRDSQVRALAYNIIQAQETEITWMKQWLRRIHLIMMGRK